MTVELRRSPIFLLLSATTLLASIPSCGPSVGQVPLHPTSGQVLFQGKPLAGVQVIFKPVKANQLGASSGRTGADGKFSMSTPAGESGQLANGVPAGDYLVTIVTPSRADSAGFLNKTAKKFLPDLIKNKFADSKTSGLKATVKAGENTLDQFALQ